MGEAEQSVCCLTDIDPPEEEYSKREDQLGHTARLHMTASLTEEVRADKREAPVIDWGSGHHAGLPTPLESGLPVWVRIFLSDSSAISEGDAADPLYTPVGFALAQAVYALLTRTLVHL